VPTIKEAVETKVSSTRLGKLDRNSFKQSKLDKATLAEEATTLETSQNAVSIDDLNDSNNKIPSVHEIMDEYCNTQSQRVSGLIKSISYSLNNSDLILTVSSRAQELAVEDLRIPLLQHLLKVSRNTITNVLCVMGKVEETERRPYTDKEKLDFFLKKHPELNKAIEKLHLRLL
jgi:hypothetical protein